MALPKSKISLKRINFKKKIIFEKNLKKYNLKKYDIFLKKYFKYKL